MSTGWAYVYNDISECGLLVQRIKAYPGLEGAFGGIPDGSRMTREGSGSLV